MISQARSRTARATELRAAALAGVAALTLLWAGCGSDEPTAQIQPPSGGAGGANVEEAKAEGDVVDISGTEPVGEMTAGSVASLVECRDWNDADEAQKLATIADVRSQINLEDSGIDAPALTDDEAMELYANACKADYAQGFRLYKIYAHAAGFVTMKRMLDDPEAAGE